jgi:hypothetical protein
MCKFLIDNGAEINKKGGESIATPLQWAAQRCHYYAVNLLLQHGADPLVTDAQGYNTLHISTFNGNVLLIVLLLHQGIPVDVPDSYGHTALMWSAYKGFPGCVDVFLRWGANVHATDEQGFTPLHWALVKGSPGCILKLIEYGADRFAKTDAGKTPAITAGELNTISAWHRALKECGYDEDGHPAMPPWPGASYLLKDRRTFLTRFLFLWPFVLVWAVLSVLAYMPVFLGLPFAILVGYGIQWCAKQVMEYAPSDMRQFHRTPWLAGIFAATLFLTVFNWLTKVMPNGISETGSMFVLNLMFAAFAGLTTFFYAAAMRYDPGFVPKMNGIAEQKAVIDDLLQLWKFDEANFCVTCMIRTPLRSKHCRKCQRCVAKHDQYVMLPRACAPLPLLTAVRTATAHGSTTAWASTTTATSSSTSCRSCAASSPTTGCCTTVRCAQLGWVVQDTANMSQTSTPCPSTPRTRATFLGPAFASSSTGIRLLFCLAFGSPCSSPGSRCS